MPDVVNVVLVHSTGQLPDVWTGVVRALPAGWKPRPPNLSVQTLEQYLDKQELRRVVLVGHGTGALAAARLAREQPQRITHAVLSLPETPRLVPRFLRRRQEEALDTPVPTLRTATGPGQPEQLVAEISSLLAD